jgi:hypothetical protein
MKNKKAVVVFVNSGDIVLKLRAARKTWAHTYDSPQQAADDLCKWWAEGSTAGWDGDEAATADWTPTPEDWRSGAADYLVARSADSVVSQVADAQYSWRRWGNALALAVALGGAPLDD